MPLLLITVCLVPGVPGFLPGAAARGCCFSGEGTAGGTWPWGYKGAHKASHPLRELLLLHGALAAGETRDGDLAAQHRAVFHGGYFAGGLK